MPRDRWDPREWEKRLMRMIMAQEAGVHQIFNEFITASSPSLSKYKATTIGALWHHNKSIERVLDQHLQTLHLQLSHYLKSQSNLAWDLSSRKTDILVANYIHGMDISDVARQGLFDRNARALEAFQKRRVGKLDHSARVWKICDQAKENVEYYLQSGVGSGRSAAQISRDIRGMLKDPNKLFRRVRDPETGKLKPSRPMGSYHPGQGVYRSSYQNALRMTRTETNMAYRFADQERWKKMDFVIGYEVKLSGSHPVFDICDSMVGKYPKTFVFGGWHPNCYCYTVPILATQDQFAEYLKSGKKLPGQIRTMPGKASQYIRNNTDRIKGWTTQPYWVRDNFTLKDGKFVPQRGLRMIPPGVLKPPVTKPKVTPTPIPKSTPAPEPVVIPDVSEAFESIGRSVKESAMRALAAINKVHGDGKLPKIPVKGRKNLAPLAQYEHKQNLITGEHFPSGITLRNVGPWQEMSMLHETGHFLDHAGIGGPSDFDTLKGTLTKSLMASIKKSKAVKELQKMLSTGIRMADGKEVRLMYYQMQHVKYLLSEEEIFARAYSQYIAVKSKDPKLLSQLPTMRSATIFPSQWQDEDFVPLVKEFDKLFKQLGWLR